MTLNGAINFNETNDYTVFTMNSTNAGMYCAVLPKNNSGNYNMLVDLHMKSLFDEVNSGSKSKDDLVNVISEEYGKIKNKYNDAILVIPMFDEANYINIINTNDKQKMFDEVKKIGAITSEIYKNLIESGIEKQKIDQKIIILEKDENDKKFVLWLEEQMPNFVDGVAMNELDGINVNSNVSEPVVEVPNIFGEPVVAEAAIPVVETPVVEPVVEAPAVEPVAVSESVAEVPNIFGEQPVMETPVQQPVMPQPVVETPVQQPVVGAPAVAEPQPVQSVELNDNLQQAPVANVAPVEEQVVGEEEEQSPKKKNGFVNLAVLLGMLVVVTIVSIELGKFLYNTYGV